MAIPFIVPSGEDNHSEADLEQLLCDLIDINQQIQILLRARMQNRTASYISTRVCTSPRHSSSRNQNVVAEASTMPDLVSNLPLLSPATNSRTDIQHILPTGQNLSVPTIRTRRQRTNSESSCCDHAKYTVFMDAHHDESRAELSTEDVDWSQVGVIIRQVADDFKPAASKDDHTVLSLQSSSSFDGVKTETKSLLSKLIPTSTSSCSIWTAVICVVGWRLFRAR